MNHGGGGGVSKIQTVYSHLSLISDRLKLTSGDGKGGEGRKEGGGSGEDAGKGRGAWRERQPTEVKAYLLKRSTCAGRRKRKEEEREEEEKEEKREEREEEKREDV